PQVIDAQVGGGESLAGAAVQRGPVPVELPAIELRVAAVAEKPGDAFASPDPVAPEGARRVPELPQVEGEGGDPFALGAAELSARALPETPLQALVGIDGDQPVRSMAPGGLDQQGPVGGLVPDV